MPLEHHTALVDCTMPSSLCSSSLAPFTLLILSYILARGAPGTTSQIFSSQSCPRLRFVVFFLRFPPYCSVEIRLLNHDAQVIAPFLVVLRVANRSALTNNSIVSGNLNLGSIRFGGQGKSTGANRTLSDGFPVSSMEMNAETSGELGVRVETIVDEVPSRQG